LLNAYDVVAPRFDRHRRLPDGVPEKIRAAILRMLSPPSPRLLDVGAGSGRIGAAFIAAGDDYVGVDLSAGMLNEFAGRERAARLVQANGRQLPFRDGAFDAVLLIQVFGGLSGWREVIAEARRVLRPRGAIVVGRTQMPADGIDARLKQQLAAILDDVGRGEARANAREDAMSWLAANAQSRDTITAATWTATRTPRGFMDRHGGGARFAQLPESIRTNAMRQLGAWATATFGTLTREFAEPHSFELHAFRCENGNS
jgi:ubiquinone/menaquinone biosynthesis C-methylase UbiE